MPEGKRAARILGQHTKIPAPFRAGGEPATASVLRSLPAGSPPLVDARRRVAGYLRGSIRKGLAHALALALAGPLAHAALGQTLPSRLGWYELPETRLSRVCPPNGFGGSGYDFSDHCRYVTEAWNSAVFDRARNRLIIWGGGHEDYLGNELYALDLDSLGVKRLTDPGLPVSTVGCPESVANGRQPNARHTYDGIAYLEHADRLFVFGGSLSSCGYLSRATWTFDFTTSTWEHRRPSGPIPQAVPGVVTGYDPNTRKVFLHDETDLYSYDVETDRYRRLASGSPIDYHMTGVIDPKRRRFVIVGAGRVYMYDIGLRSSFRRRTLATDGADSLVNSIYPGLAYDPVADRIVAWNGGDTVYSLDLDTGVWVPTTFAGGPGSALENGTFKRWSYSRASGVFVVVNAMDAKLLTLRLTLPNDPRYSAPPSRP